MGGAESEHLCQCACDARAERLGDQLATSRADSFGGRVHRHDLAVLVAADGGKDGTPALVPELVASELDGRQCAINAKCISDGVDALCDVVAFLRTILNPDTTETIV